MSLANCYARQGKNLDVTRELGLAQSYELDSKACETHANILLSKSRPRAALRRLDKALERISDRDLSPAAWTPLRATGWNLRIQAGRCACLCAEQEVVSKPVAERDWTRKHLPVATERLGIALASAPGHAPLQQMMARAHEMLEAAQL